MPPRESNLIQVGRGFELKRAPTPPVEKLLPRLDKACKTTADSWMASCPAHENSSPSLSIKRVSDGTLVVKCTKSCRLIDILAAVRLDLKDLFPPVRRR